MSGRVAAPASPPRVLAPVLFFFFFSCFDVSRESRFWSQPLCLLVHVASPALGAELSYTGGGAGGGFFFNHQHTLTSGH